MSSGVVTKYEEAIEAVVQDTPLNAGGNEEIAKWKASVLEEQRDKIKYNIQLALMRKSVDLGNAVTIADMEVVVDATYERFVKVIAEQLDK